MIRDSLELCIFFEMNAGVLKFVHRHENLCDVLRH
jgi:hypothetical protein